MSEDSSNRPIDPFSILLWVSLSANYWQGKNKSFLKHPHISGAFSIHFLIRFLEQNGRMSPLYGRHLIDKQSWMNGWNGEKSYLLGKLLSSLFLAYNRILRVLTCILSGFRTGTEKKERIYCKDFGLEIIISKTVSQIIFLSRNLVYIWMNSIIHFLRYNNNKNDLLWYS